jgi:hypothetical protein
MFQDSRWLSSAEAIYEIFAYPVHEEFPNVVRLAIHEDNKQMALYRTKEGKFEALKLRSRFCRTSRLQSHQCFETFSCHVDLFAGGIVGQQHLKMSRCPDLYLNCIKESRRKVRRFWHTMISVQNAKTTIT